jgi:putative membrane protein
MNPVFLKRFLIVLYASGLVGMHIPAVSATFISLVPLTLWFTGFICFWFFPKPSIQAYVLLAAIAVAAWMLEVGEYAYGRTLGYQVLNVPITIGINWILLVMVTGAVVQEWNVGGKIGRAALGAGLMTALDVLIEPIAVHFDFWQWNNNYIPIQNFIAWWVASFFFHWVYISADLPAKSSLFRLIAALQFLFFLGHWILMQINL